MSVDIYVEGGGDKNSATITACRKGFHTFFKKMLANKDQPAIKVCGARSQAYSDFRKALSSLGEGQHALLLVDSEGPIENEQPWDYLKERDQWQKPEGASDDHVHLMVQCMESWFLADSDKLADHYEKGFKKNLIPKPVNDNVEAIAKSKVETALKSATRGAAAKMYHKTRDAFKILESIDPEKVCKASRHAARLRKRLEDLLPDRSSRKSR